MLSVVVPNRISDGRSLPKVDVLIRGMKLPTYDDTGTFVGECSRTIRRGSCWICSEERMGPR